MTCKKDFERYLECKGDEIDNAAYALAVALLRTHPDQTNEEILPWDMSIIAPIIESAQEELERSGKQTCWPYYEEAGLDTLLCECRWVRLFIRFPPF